MVQTYNHWIWEVEIGGIPANTRATWSAIIGQPELQKKALSQKKKAQIFKFVTAEYSANHGT